METLKQLAARLTAEERAEYEAMAQGILDDADRLAIVGYLLKTHFEEEAARGVLDESPAAEGEAGGAAEDGRAALPHTPHHAVTSTPGHHGPTGGGPTGGGRRRRRRRRGGGARGGPGGGAGGHGSSGGHLPGAA